MPIARTLAVLGCFAGMALAQPPLTTIQDVIYKADGTPFNGLVFISWTGFEASDTSNVATQNVTARIVNGNLAVKLVPTTNANSAASYSVTYNSDGKVQFQETWAVPPSTTPLRVRDVRNSVVAPPPLITLPIQESDVTNLVNDLAARPIKGPGFATGRTAWINGTGGIEGVAGNASDCVHVDGTSGACGSGGGSSSIDQETPGGLVDGSNGAFTLAESPDPPSSLALYRNGLLQKSGFDYSVSGNTVQFVSTTVPQPGDTLLASYRIGSPPETAGRLMVSRSAGDDGAPRIVCSSPGKSTSLAQWSTLGSCTIPGGRLASGDRLEVRFDYAHTGKSSGFDLQVLWGSTVLMNRSAGPGDVRITGRAEAAIDAGTAQLSSESWGTAAGFAAGLGSAADRLDLPLTVAFQGRMRRPAAEKVALSGFTVIRYPAVTNQ